MSRAQTSSSQASLGTCRGSGRLSPPTPQPAEGGGPSGRPQETHCCGFMGKPAAQPPSQAPRQGGVGGKIFQPSAQLLGFGQGGAGGHQEDLLTPQEGCPTALWSRKDAGLSSPGVTLGPQSPHQGMLVIRFLRASQ